MGWLGAVADVKRDEQGVTLCEGGRGGGMSNNSDPFYHLGVEVVRGHLSTRSAVEARLPVRQRLAFDNLKEEN